MEFKHISVMKEECLVGLNLQSGGIYFDGTLGGGGHSYEILKRTSPNGKLIATDLDRDAIQAASQKLSEFDGRFTIVNDNFKNFKQVIQDLEIDAVDGVLLDLGVSSFQLDARERGFSYLASDVRLDMRMNQSQKLSAYEVVNEYDEKELKRILFEYGEERFTNKIVAEIIAQRKKAPIETTGQLVNIIEKSIPAKFKTDGHPAKRTFQAIRIEVNGELDGLYETVLDMARSLKKGGRIAILTFHSLEDRIVKQAFKYLECDCICDKSLPVCVCDKKQEIKILTTKPITATVEELNYNPRAKSAKLRIAEKI